MIRGSTQHSQNLSDWQKWTPLEWDTTLWASDPTNQGGALFYWCPTFPYRRIGWPHGWRVCLVKSPPSGHPIRIWIDSWISVAIGVMIPCSTVLLWPQSLSAAMSLARIHNFRDRLGNIRTQ